MPTIRAAISILVAAAASGVAVATCALAGKKAASPLAVLATWGGTDSRIEDLSVERIRDETAWKALWTRHAPDVQPTAVDFSKGMVIAFFFGRVMARVVPSVDLESVTESDRIDVTIKYFFNDVLGDRYADHYLFVELPRSDKAVRVLGLSYALMRTPRETVDVLAELAAVPAPSPR